MGWTKWHRLWKIIIKIAHPTNDYNRSSLFYWIRHSINNNEPSNLYWHFINLVRIHFSHVWGEKILEQMVLIRIFEGLVFSLDKKHFLAPWIRIRHSHNKNKPSNLYLKFINFVRKHFCHVWGEKILWQIVSVGNYEVLVF